MKAAHTHSLKLWLVTTPRPDLWQLLPLILETNSDVVATRLHSCSKTLLLKPVGKQLSWFNCCKEMCSRRVELISADWLCFTAVGPWLLEARLPYTLQPVSPCDWKWLSRGRGCRKLNFWLTSWSLQLHAEKSPGKHWFFHHFFFL